MIGRNEVHRSISAALGTRANAMLDRLAEISSQEDGLTRTYLSREHRQAADVVAGWMKDAGMQVSIDGLGTVRGRYEPPNARRNSDRIFLIGSHIDTVVDAGRFDGMLGVVAGILAVGELQAREIELPFIVDVLAFGDEEGTRFPTNLLSSSGVCGPIAPEEIDRVDAGGVTVRQALEQFHSGNWGTTNSARLTDMTASDPSLDGLAYDRDKVLGYLEMHIEQGNVLEHEGLAVGIVTDITGSNRYTCIVQGTAGHAGTVPMNLRQDAFAATAELAMRIEQIAKSRQDVSMVATVGKVSIDPGAINVIPGRVDFTLDLRASEDEARYEAMDLIRKAAEQIGNRRGVEFDFRHIQEVLKTPCSKMFDEKLGQAFEQLNLPDFRLPSGAGHDGQAMVNLTDIGMIFVRCRGGVSHSPKEFVEEQDMAVAIECMIATLEAFGRD